MNMINILGTEYIVRLCEESQMQDKDNYGECDRYSKVIKINADAFEGENLTNDIEGVVDKTIRHEILHAIFHEAGLDCYAEDEILVDALAILYPKIDRILTKATHKKLTFDNKFSWDSWGLFRTEEEERDCR